MIIGPSFVEAYEYCESQNWIGLLLSPSATLAVRNGGLEPLHHDFVKDNIPLKDPSLENDNLLAYRFQNGSSNYESPLISFLDEMRHFAPEDVKVKYTNTLDFIRKLSPSGGGDRGQGKGGVRGRQASPSGGASAPQSKLMRSSAM